MIGRSKPNPANLQSPARPPSLSLPHRWGGDAGEGMRAPEKLTIFRPLATKASAWPNSVLWLILSDKKAAGGGERWVMDAMRRTPPFLLDARAAPLGAPNFFSPLRP